MTSPQTAAIVVAHPGHEVRVHGWLEQHRPLVFILTDGSGRTSTPRIASTAEYLKKFGMRPGCVFARFTDMDVYRLLLARDFEPFIGLSEELAGALVEAGVGCVVGDASEGYNSTHDVFRLITNAAVELASRASGSEIENYDFPVVYRPDHCPEQLRARSIWLRLDEEAFARKLAAAFEFYPELAAETADALRGVGDKTASSYFHLDDDAHAATDLAGLDMFRVECLRPVAHGDPPFHTEKPFYEIHGETKVAEGFYTDVIRYREHIAPLADALNENVERKA